MLFLVSEGLFFCMAKTKQINKEHIEEVGGRYASDSESACAPLCCKNACAARPVFIHVVGDPRAADPSNVHWQGPVKQNASPREPPEGWVFFLLTGRSFLLRGHRPLNVREGRTWAIAVRRGSYESLFLPNSGRISL